MASTQCPFVLFGKTDEASAMWPFKTRVKHSLSYWLGLPKWTVLVTSVVPSLYWAPESRR